MYCQCSKKWKSQVTSKSCESYTLGLYVFYMHILIDDTVLQVFWFHRHLPVTPRLDGKSTQRYTGKSRRRTQFLLSYRSIRSHRNTCRTLPRGCSVCMATICIVWIHYHCRLIYGYFPSGTGNHSRWKVCMLIWFKYDLGQKVYVPQVRPDWGSNS